VPISHATNVSRLLYSVRVSRPAIFGGELHKYAMIGYCPEQAHGQAYAVENVGKTHERPIRTKRTP
jgi:hypothetical protein